MCGIVGFMAKKRAFAETLGEHVVPMLNCMGDRGPDSAGLALFSRSLPEMVRRFSLHVDGQPHPCCPRTNLKRVLREAAEAGYVFNVGMEPEFFLVTRDASIRVIDSFS